MRIAFGVLPVGPELNQAQRKPVSDAVTQTPDGFSQPSSALYSVYFSGHRPVTKNQKPVTPQSILASLSAQEKKALEAYSQRYMDFLKEAVCSPWTAKAMIERAEKAGFKPFPTDDKAKIKPGEKYYLNNRYQSVAFVVIGENDPTQSGFNIVGAHMDSPQLELKPETLLENKDMVKLKTKPHGGGLWSTWENRPLGLAGQVFMPVMTKGKQEMDPANGRPLVKRQFVRIDRAIGSINLPAIHLRRDLNESHPINKETDSNPLISLTGDDVVKTLKQESGIDLSQANRGELYLFPVDPPTSSGIDNSLINAQGHDDRSMCYAALEGIIEAGQAKQPPAATSMAIFFEDEENGSRGAGGANSNWAAEVAGDIVARHIKSHGQHASNTQARERALGNSFILSADVAHAWDENHASLHDSQNSVYMGLGPAIKMDSNGSYATTPETAAITMDLFKKADVPYQVANFRQDMPCGSTIGTMIAANTCAQVADIGPAILSMHSVQEVGSKADFYLTKKAFASFFKG